jgi:hypothetical protein
VTRILAFSSTAFCDLGRPFGAISVENECQEGRHQKRDFRDISHNRTEPSQLIMATIMALCVGLASAQQSPRITANGNNLNVATGYGQGQLSVDGVSSFPPGLARVSPSQKTAVPCFAGVVGASTP